MPSETMYDSVTGGDLPSDAKLVLYYVDGDYANFAAVRKQCPTAQLIPVTTSSKGDLNAQVYDCERGDGNAITAALWALQKIKLSQRPTIYCSRIGSPGYGYPDVQRQITNLKLTGQVDYGIADYTGHPHLVPGSAFTQYANPPSSGGDYDISITNGVWPDAPTPPPPPPPVPPAPTPTEEEDDMDEVMKVIESPNDGNRHVFIYDPTTKSVTHWYQNMKGAPNFNWNREVLPGMAE